MQLSPGGYAPRLNIPGNNLEHVYTFRERNDAEAVKARMADAKKVIVIGAGYIGIEVAEAFVRNGLEVTVLDAVDRFLPTYLDKEFYPRLSAEAENKGLTFKGKEFAQEVLDENGIVTGLVTDQGEYEADTIIMACGVKPDTDWLKGTLDVDKKGFVLTNEFLETSAEDVYAGGDATYLNFNPTGKEMNIGLATNARKQGVVAAKNALGGNVKAPGVNGTSGLAFFDLNFATTGIKDSMIETYDGEVKAYYCEEKIQPDFMRNEDNTVEMKIFYDADTEVILGAQFLSKEDVTQAANTLSLAITAKMTLTQLAQADFFFQPGFSRPWHFLNVLALRAKGQTYGSTEMLF